MPGMAGVGKKPRLAGETTAGTGTETGIETGTETGTETGIEETGTTEIGIATEVGGIETEIGKVIVAAEDEVKNGGRYDSVHTYYPARLAYIVRRILIAT